MTNEMTALVDWHPGAMYLLERRRAENMTLANCWQPGTTMYALYSLVPVSMQHMQFTLFEFLVVCVYFTHV